MKNVTEGLAEAARESGVSHWATQEAARYLATQRHSRSFQDIGGAIGCSTSLLTKRREEWERLGLIKLDGQLGGAFYFVATEQGRALAELVNEELGPFTPLKRTTRPTRPESTPPRLGVAPSSNGHASPNLIELIDRSTLAQIREMASGLSGEERKFLRAVVLGRTGLGDA